MEQRSCDLPSCQKSLPDEVEEGFWRNHGGLDFCCREHWLVYHGQKICNRDGCDKVVDTIEFYYDYHYYCSIHCRQEFVLQEPCYYVGQRGSE